MLLIEWLKVLLAAAAVLYAGIWHPVARGNLVGHPGADHLRGLGADAAHRLGEVTDAVDYLLRGIHRSLSVLQCLLKGKVIEEGKSLEK